MRLSTIKRWISPRLSIQGKIFWAFCLVSLLSITAISSIVYLNMRDTIKENAVTSVLDSIRQADESLNIMLEEIDRLNTSIVTSRTTVIDTILSPTREISYERFQEQKQLEEFLSSLRAHKPYITRIAIVGLNGKVFFSGSPWMDSTILKQPIMDYMKQNASRHAYVKQTKPIETITVGREIRFNREMIAMIMVDLDYAFVRKTYGVKPTADSLFYVLDEQNEFIYRSEQTPEALSSPAAIIHMKEDFRKSKMMQGDMTEKVIGGRNYIVVSRLSAYTGWTTLAFIPLDSLLSESTRLRKLILEASAIVLLLVLIASLQVSSRITINIRRLKAMMMLVKDGNMSFPKKKITTHDEVGQLYHVFIGMVEELKQLLEDFRVSEKGKREAELTALQAQIRPHFLYNSLNTIKYLAKLNGVPNIEEASGSLINLMRAVLGNANEFLTVREELDYVRNYISIVKYKYMEPIVMQEEIEAEHLLDRPMLKLTLQPIVENAIVHGVGSREQGGCVTIRVYEKWSDLIIEVIDNGPGMTEEQIEQLLAGQDTGKMSSRFSGMGVRNVHERIRHSFGEHYGISVYSELGRYTKVEIRMPRLLDPLHTEQEAID